MARPREVHTTCSFDSSSVSTVAMLSVQEDGGMTSNFSASASPSSASTSTSTSTSCNTDDQNTMTGAASIPTACNSSVDDESSWGRSSASDLTAKTKQAVTTPSTTDSTRSGNFECDLVRLQELERKRLALRHQRFNLEQRLSEFCGKHAEGGSPITPTGRPCQNVLDFQWKDTSTGLKVVYTGQLNEFGQPHGSQGRLQFADGQVYMGDVRNGYRAGQGRNSWPDGQDYVGEWKKNSRNGRGTHVWPDGRKVSGLWLDGHLNGKVYFSWPNGATYDGMVRKGKKHGRGE